MELKPCPWQMPGEEFHKTETVYDKYPDNIYHIKCITCGATGPFVKRLCSGDESIKAALLWNRRPEPAVSKMENADILKGIDSEDCPEEFNKIFQDNFKDILA